MSIRGRAAQFLREHALFAGLVGAYFAGAAVYFSALGRWDDWMVRPAYPMLTLAAVTVSAARLLISRVWHRGASPLWRPEAILGAVLVLALIVPFQTTFTSIKRTIYDVRGLTWDPWLADVDRLVHGGRHPWEWLYWVAQDQRMIFWLDRMYLWWFPLVTAFVFWAAWTPLRRLRQRALISTVLVWIVGGNLVAFALASGGPCYYRQVVPDRPDPYERLLGTLDLQARSGEYVQARVIQHMLWNVTAGSAVAPLRGVSAMPSIHVAMAVLLALVGWARHPVAGVILAGYAATTMIGSVVLGWHYAVDGYVGALLAVAIWRVSARLVPETLTTAAP